jgi:hypothetical protein
MDTILVNARLTFEYPVAPPVIPPEIAGKRGFILHDFQSAETGYALFRYKLPETEKFGDSFFEKMYEARQWFWFNLIVFYADGTKTMAQLKSFWAGLTAGNKAFCNKHGGQNNPPVGNDAMFIDYINDTGNRDEPMSQENLTTCGNMIVLTGNNRSIGGVPYVALWCLDSTAPMPVNIQTHPLLDYFIHSATTITGDNGTRPNFPRNSIAPNGTFVVNNFPNLKDKVPVPLFYAKGQQSEIMGLKVREGWLRADRVCKLDDDEMPSPLVR